MPDERLADHVVEPLVQLRADRRHALNAWLVRSDGARWPGDDGRVLYLDERFAWLPNVVAAEIAEFERLDAIYNAAKTALRIP